MTDQSNVLLICTDHWPGALLGEAGHSVVMTPTLDQLARNGIRYTRSYSTCPVCIPARRTLMTGTSPRSHEVNYNRDDPWPQLPTIAQTFRDAGYQAYAVGKLHVMPQRHRIGFDDVILVEEGRTQWGVTDDYEVYLGEYGYAGQQFAGGMNNNEYLVRPWHLPEQFHVTNFTTQQMARTIKRRDPTRPAFWYLSYTHPHPPLAPLRDYLELYQHMEVDEPYFGEWDLPNRLYMGGNHRVHIQGEALRLARRAFYALCTHIDHQIRYVLGTIREEGQLANTIIVFTSDHGDMLGNHGLWAKNLFYENSAHVPLILSGQPLDRQGVDDRLVCLEDIMPTLLTMCGIDVPESVDGMSMIGDDKRETLYGECNVDAMATRMLNDGRHKLIYYPVGNVSQLFDLEKDPYELNDVADQPQYTPVLAKLQKEMIARLHGTDLDWLQDGELVGLPDMDRRQLRPNYVFSGQRGTHWPPPQARDDTGW